MAVRPGEDLTATLFADVHYYYGSPTADPPHHRFDKSSYVYLFENAGQRRARIEVANNAGKPNQDAFNGYLDTTSIKYSYRHTNLVSVAVDGQGATSKPGDGQEWRLPHFDPKNENKYMYRLHTVDLYFWIKEDALKFVSSVRRVLPQHQISIEDEPVAALASDSTPLPHTDVMSPVVQKLECAVISDPSYQQGQTQDSRATSASFPGPPVSAAYSDHTPPAPTPPQTQPVAFVPIAYNPAAPAAPEAIKHREKTPPPADGATNPLVAATAQDHGQTYGGGFQQRFGGFSGRPTSQTQASYFPSQSAPLGPPGIPPPVQAQTQQVQSPHAQHFQNSFSPPPTAPINTVQSPPAYKADPSPQFANYPGSPGLSSPMTSPAIYSPGFAPSHQPTPGAYNPAASPPPGGFAQYSYGASNTSLSNTPAMQTQYSVHQQVYRPTEAEAGTKHHEKPKPAGKAPSGKFEQRAGQLEKGMTGLFRKLEKKIG
ncbi:hypothetical protein BJ878DRAFT_480801 [Calycina marina]|uniref:Hydroxyproline-rich glycoprotein n=1 Tax=Calycina marina TaxID=1763456 RepID=A0A9P7Z196_9HELO|nr:hypothetical protein BJ878DRAFT_480801 [Calycina marina]